MIALITLTLKTLGKQIHAHNLGSEAPSLKRRDIFQLILFAFLASETRAALCLVEVNVLQQGLVISACMTANTNSPTGQTKRRGIWKINDPLLHHRRS